MNKVFMILVVLLLVPNLIHSFGLEQVIFGGSFKQQNKLNYNYLSTFQIGSHIEPQKQGWNIFQDHNNQKNSSGLNGAIYDIGFSKDRSTIYVVGSFTNLGAKINKTITTTSKINHVAKWNTVERTFASLDEGISTKKPDTLRVETVGNNVYVSGSISNIPNTKIKNAVFVVFINGTEWKSLEAPTCGGTSYVPSQLLANEHLIYAMNSYTENNTYYTCVSEFNTHSKKWKSFKVNSGKDTNEGLQGFKLALDLHGNHLFLAALQHPAQTNLSYSPVYVKNAENVWSHVGTGGIKFLKEKNMKTAVLNIDDILINYSDAMYTIYLAGTFVASGGYNVASLPYPHGKTFTALDGGAYLHKTKNTKVSFLTSVKEDPKSNYTLVMAIGNFDTAGGLDIVNVGIWNSTNSTWLNTTKNQLAPGLNPDHVNVVSSGQFLPPMPGNFWTKTHLFITIGIGVGSLLVVILGIFGISTLPEKNLAYQSVN
eukprot:TRINITY_DN8323_c0_g1_i1.p1 TRINITY_DN8323_c0_g1~~TRINITY_DN8323_c0_g1_i1.p1  ORF type:complete len:483 (-),score=84.52 TRINITY_DN8323_c0_g1_i1:36-1484(-)